MILEDPLGSGDMSVIGLTSENYGLEKYIQEEVALKDGMTESN